MSSPSAQVALHVASSFLPEIDRRFEGIIIASFAIDIGQLLFQIEIIYIQVDDFGYAETGMENKAYNACIADRITLICKQSLLVVGNIDAIALLDDNGEIQRFPPPAAAFPPAWPLYPSPYAFA